MAINPYQALLLPVNGDGALHPFVNRRFPIWGIKMGLRTEMEADQVALTAGLVIDKRIRKHTHHGFSFFRILLLLAMLSLLLLGIIQ